MRSSEMTLEFGRSAARPSVRRMLAATVSGAAMILAASAAAAAAQTAETTADAAGVEEVVVSASRITAAGFDAPTPTTVLGAEMIEQQAQPNLFNAIAQLPSLQGSTGTTVANGNTSTGMTGLSGLNLRGLGTFRTLTLLDGQRVVPSNVNNIVDVSQFPQLLVERVEVVTGGASASYGSDAVAGVVNFITNKRFTGFKANIQGGVSTYGDAQRANIQGAYGRSFLNDRLHLTVSGEYLHNGGAPGELIGGIPVNGRKPLPRTGSISTSIANTPAGGAPQNTYFLDGFQDITRLRNGLITAGPLQGIAFGNGGVPYQFQYGGSGIPRRTAAGGVIGCGTACQGGDFRGLTSSANGGSDIDALLNRGVAYGRLSYEVSDNLEIYATYNYADVFTITTPTRKAQKPGLTAQCDNAFLHPSISQLCAQNGITSFTWGTISENLPHDLRVNNERKQRRYVIGADGSFNVFGKEWTFASYFQHGESIARINVQNNVLTPHYNAAVDAIRLPTGEIVCRNTVARAAGCVPFNAFGNVPNSESAYRWFAPYSGSRQQTFQRQDAASIAINGVPFRNWAGDVSVAFGVDWREEFYKTAGDPYGAGLANSPTSELYPNRALISASGDNWYAGNFKNGRGRFDVKEGFVEVGVPIWDTASLGNFSLNAAARLTDYSTSGRVTTWKLGGVWDTPIDGVRLRAVRSRDIRAPNLSDLFAAPLQVNSFFIDRFNGDRTVQAQNSTVGNPLLTPEISANLEAGIVFQPSWLPGFRASFDYFDINMKDAVQVLGGQQIIDLCFNGVTQLCPNVFLNGQLGTNNPSFVRVAPFNLASLKTNGFDIEASYRFNLRSMGVPGGFTFRGLATHTLDFTTDPGVPGQPILQLAGNNVANNPAPGTTGVAKWKAFLMQTWEVGPVQFTLTERVISKGNINPNFIVCQTNCPQTTVQNPTSNFNTVPGEVYVDFGVNYQLRDAIEVYARVDNVFNDLAPPFGSNSLYDTIGRRYSAGIRLNY